MFGSRNRTSRTTRAPRRSIFSTDRSRSARRSGGRGFFHRKDPNRRAAGLKAALHNPNTTHEGRREAKDELRMMGRGNEAHGHPSLKSRIKRMFGIRSTKSRSRFGSRNRRY
ncbi:hypothetical protein SCHPADRAFT_861478 [Schizopora paradoxa]|uniref:Uncharacterized protein n=1 Tax=Schizopora paradoxa TaxID=27342 RepID=A0A0H2R3I3_9AGAM|nr:hypothetical protein SCHPADRAFT_861478 [Schizopora paradoxa]